MGASRKGSRTGGIGEFGCQRPAVRHNSEEEDGSSCDKKNSCQTVESVPLVVRESLPDGKRDPDTSQVFRVLCLISHFDNI